MKTLGKFEILEKLGQGAMGVVYKARDPLIGRQVALKTITTGLADDPSLLERFYHEAHSAGALQHPNIVTIYELGEADNTPFIAMEYLAGQSLDKVIEGHQQLPLSQKVGYVVYVCRALGFAHKQGVVHRDVKPANVMVTSDGTVKVVDFGIARIAENSKSQTGLIIGTLGYMSPQQIEGGRADARSDIWAAGVLFYELLAYHRPFDGENYGALMLNVMTRDIPPLSETAPGTPPEVTAVVEWMLRKDVDQRFQSMEEVLMELEPVWRSIERGEVANLLENSRTLLKAGDVGRAYETVRRILQMDTANTQAKDLLEQINAETRKGRTLPVGDRSPKDDETYIGTPTDIGRPPTSSIPALAASRAQSTPTKSVPASDTASRLKAAVTQRPATVQPQAAPTIPSPAPAPAAGMNWKKQAPIALVVLALMIGGGTYFFAFRRPATSTAATNLPTPSAPVSSGPANPGPSSVVPGATETASGNTASTSSDKKSQPPAGNSVIPNGPAGKFFDANAQNRATPAPQQQTPKDQAGTAPVAPPPPSNRTEIAANIPVPPPTAQPSQPAAVSPQPTAPASQPAAVPVPTPAVAKPADPAPAPASQPVAAAPAPAAPVKSSQDSLDSQSITLLLQQLSAAWAHKSLSEMDAIYPKNTDRNSLKAVFGDAKSVSCELHTPTINVASDGTHATAIGNYDRKIVDGRGVPNPQSGNYYVRFSKKNGRWLIDDASY